MLLSWAVPKGPSLDPNDKRLAMHVEDHPLEYGDFEGVIPAKQYGAGTVMVWDRGTWAPKADPDEGYAKGRLKFDLDGEKLKGGWNLVRSRGGKYGGENSWLLFKEADEFARLGAEGLIAEDRPESVVSGRSLEQIAADADRVWHSNKSVAANVKGGAIRKPAREHRRRARQGQGRAQGADAGPDRSAVGDRGQIAADGSGMGARDQVRRLPHVVPDCTSAGTDGVAHCQRLDRRLRCTRSRARTAAGRRCVARRRGRRAGRQADAAAFRRCKKRFLRRIPASLKYLAFDLLHLNGFDLRGVALSERKRLLRELLSNAPAAIQYSEHFARSGTRRSSRTSASSASKG